MRFLEVANTFLRFFVHRGATGGVDDGVLRNVRHRTNLLGSVAGAAIAEELRARTNQSLPDSASARRKTSFAAAVGNVETQLTRRSGVTPEVETA
jgi:hypothetical protein